MVNRARAQIYPVLVAALFALMGLKVLDTLQSKRELATILASAVARDLQVGDLRSVVTNLGIAAAPYFDEVALCQKEKSVERCTVLTQTEASRILWRIGPLPQTHLRFGFYPFEGLWLWWVPLVFVVFACGETLARLIATNRQKENEKALLVKTSEARADLARQVAHDIRAPTAALKGWMLLIAEKLSGEGELLLLGRKITERIDSIADDLLKTERNACPDKGKAQNHVHVVPLLQSLIQQKKIELLNSARVIFNEQYALEPAAQAWVPRVGLERAVSNLLNNAIESSEGKLTITVSSKKQNGMIEILIADDGCGIPAPTLKLLQSGRERGVTTKINGNGLGISAARELIEESGGNFSIQSNPDSGTQVLLTLVPFA